MPTLFGVATFALGGLAFLPYLLSAAVRKQMPGGAGEHRVGSCVRRDPSGLLARLWYPLGGGAGAPDGSWLPQPEKTPALYLQAIGAFLNLPPRFAGWLLGPGLKSVRGAWLEQSEPGALPDNGGERFPIVVFSHGLGAFQTVYSVLCCELASRGYVVIMPEHADASAAVTTFPDDSTPIYCERSSEARMNDPKTGAPDGGFAWRNGQIHQRVGQVFTALGSLLSETSSDKTHTWNAKLDAGNVTMAGHSFGGATTVAACAAAPPSSGGPASIPAPLGFTGFRCGVVRLYT